jgi:peptidoglycan/LPS O-acetylase OafA/YrhL
MKKRNTLIEKTLIHWGKLSFSIYYIHWGIIALGLMIFPLFIPFNNEVKLFALPTLILLSIILISLDIFLRIWKKYNYAFGIEWIMKKLTPNKRNS